MRSRRPRAPLGMPASSNFGPGPNGSEPASGDRRVRGRLEPDRGLVVLSGGGTSGQMAFLTSVSFNQLMKGLGQKPLSTYLIAGGDRSVMASWERTEDSTLHGIQELRKVAAGKKRVIVIGISVGLSVSVRAG
ncbi:glucokinase regulatory protein-like isoform X2 [Peromyscus eremicus]|uniref:glucokinase regulatory protein-like isoform X2 n=1 Tax=Peromyscus eremicus TaxID=42410 RepID=UPI0027DC8A67|nr:glucokinase regulatory protein-like isoform X2 [Peromyscus eremicus]